MGTIKNILKNFFLKCTCYLSHKSFGLKKRLNFDSLQNYIIYENV